MPLALGWLWADTLPELLVVGLLLGAPGRCFDNRAPRRVSRPGARPAEAISLVPAPLTAAVRRASPRCAPPMRAVRALLAAWTGAVMLFFYLPIAVLIAYSFNASRLNVLWEGFTLRWYGEIWRDGALLGSVRNSLIVALASTVLSVLLGTAGAWVLHRHRLPASRLLHTLVLVPMIVPEVILGVSLLIFFVAVRLELGFTTIVVSHVTFCFPFVLTAVRARLIGLDPALEEAAMDLGATPLRAFTRVLLPYLAPAIVSGALMAFTLSLDELIVTYFTASAATRTLPLEIFGRVKKGLDPTLNAISTLLVVAAVALVLITDLLQRGAVIRARRPRAEQESS